MLVVLVPLFAAAAVGAWTLSGPPQYQATAIVVPPALVSGTSEQFSGAAGSRVFVSNVLAVIDTDPVIRNISEATGLDPSELRANLSASGVGDSSVVEVSYTSSNERKAEEVATRAGQAAMTFLFQPRVEGLEDAVTEAESDLDAADGAIDAFTTDTGLLDPESEYDALLQQIATLETRALEAEANGNTASAAGLRRAIETARADLGELGVSVRDYRDLVASRTLASDALDQARDALETARAQFVATDPGSGVQIGRTEPASGMRAALQKAGATGMAAFFLAAFLVVSLDTRKRASTTPSDAAGPAAGANAADQRRAGSSGAATAATRSTA
ncbi:MAG: hypothetical protein ACRD29_21420 [Acidimicrobiales bacterium]